MLQGGIVVICTLFWCSIPCKLLLLLCDTSPTH